MGRKIPAKKHRGVKNPLEQQARREKSLKCKINAPPKDPDEQPVPRSLTDLFAFRDPPRAPCAPRAPRAPRARAGSRPATGEPECSGGKNPVSGLKRLAGESGRSFSLRIAGAVRALHDAHALCPQDMEAEDVKGQRMEELRARRRRRRRAPGAAPACPPRAPPRAEPDRGQAAPERAEVRYERVEFGDVAHAPPALRLARLPAPGASRPGRRALLLAPLLAGVQGAGARREPAPPLAGVQGARRELARREAVAAYRALGAARRRPFNKLCT